MAESRDRGSSQQDANYWPPLDESIGKPEPRYQSTNFFKNFAATSKTIIQPDSIPVDVLKQAEERVAAQKRFFKQLFTYLGIVVTVWLFSVTFFLSHPGSNPFVAVAFPLFITMLGGLRVAYSFFNAFIWLRKSHRERVMQEAQKLMY